MTKEQRTLFNAFMTATNKITKGKSCPNYNTLYNEGMRLFAFNHWGLDQILVSWNTGTWNTNNQIKADLKAFKAEYKTNPEIFQAIDYSQIEVNEKQELNEIKFLNLKGLEFWFELDLPQFMTAILQNSYAVSPDPARFGMHHLAYSIKAQHVVFTDGHRLSTTPCKILSKKKQLIELPDVFPLINHEMIQVLKVFFSKKAFNPDDYVLRIYGNHNTVALSIVSHDDLGLEIFSKISKSEYPDYQKLLSDIVEDYYFQQIIFKRERLQSISNLIEKNYLNDEDITAINFEISGDKVSVRSRHYGNYSDRPILEFIDCGNARILDNHETISLNVCYLQDYLKSLDKSIKNVRLLINGKEERRPILLGTGWDCSPMQNYYNNDGRFDLIMPMSLD